MSPNPKPIITVIDDNDDDLRLTAYEIQNLLPYAAPPITFSYPDAAFQYWEQAKTCPALAIIDYDLRLSSKKFINGIDLIAALRKLDNFANTKFILYSCIADVLDTRVLCNNQIDYVLLKTMSDIESFKFAHILKTCVPGPSPAWQPVKALNHL